MVRSFALAVATAFLGALTAVSADPTANATHVELAPADANATATRQLATGDTSYLICGMDLAGGDIKNGWSWTADGCPQLCKATTKCDSWTWTNYNGGTCWLKHLGSSWKLPVKLTPGAATFVSRPTIDHPFGATIASYANQDMPGNDFKSARGSVVDCTAICLREASCFAFTWTDYEGGTCWLKYRASATTSRGGAHSSVVVKKVPQWFSIC